VNKLQPITIFSAVLSSKSWNEVGFSFSTVLTNRLVFVWKILGIFLIFFQRFFSVFEQMEYGILKFVNEPNTENFFVRRARNAPEILLFVVL